MCVSTLESKKLLTLEGKMPRYRGVIRLLIASSLTFLFLFKGKEPASSSSSSSSSSLRVRSLSAPSPPLPPPTPPPTSIFSIDSASSAARLLPSLTPAPVLPLFVIDGATPFAPWVAAGIEWLHRRQFDGIDCATHRALLIGRDFSRTEGLGSLTHLLARRLALAISQDRVLVGTDFNWPYGGPSEDEVGRWAAGFMPLSPCSQESVGSAAGLSGEPYTTALPGPRLMAGADIPFPGQHAAGYLALVPAEFISLGWRGWWTILLAYVLRPSAGLRAQTAAYFASPTWTNLHLIPGESPSGGTIGLHVRKGDYFKQLTSAFEVHLAVARHIAARTGSRRLIVASDDAEVRRAAAEVEDFSVFIIPTRVARGDLAGSQASALDSAPSRVRSDGTSDALAVMFGMASTDFFVGTCMSQLARSAATLQIAFGRQREAPSAVDGAACYCDHLHNTPLSEGFVPAIGISIKRET